MESIKEKDREESKHLKLNVSFTIENQDRY